MDDICDVLRLHTANLRQQLLWLVQEQTSKGLSAQFLQPTHDTTLSIQTLDGSGVFFHHL